MTDRAMRETRALPIEDLLLTTCKLERKVTGGEGRNEASDTTREDCVNKKRIGWLRRRVVSPDGNVPFLSSSKHDIGYLSIRRM
ncbi:hypothetical protein J6590_018862 [Homalodisca vitripennis]|nr:hypothetical protein J6590_018862 [Homalodisca vitripennis]